jgi:hypothetical protein
MKKQIEKKYLPDFGRPNTGCTGPSEIQKVQLTKTIKLGQVSPPKIQRKNSTGSLRAH